MGRRYFRSYQRVRAFSPLRSGREPGRRRPNTTPNSPDKPTPFQIVKVSIGYNVYYLDEEADLVNTIASAAKLTSLKESEGLIIAARMKGILQTIPRPVVVIAHQLFRQVQIDNLQLLIEV